MQGNLQLNREIKNTNKTKKKQSEKEIKNYDEHNNERKGNERNEGTGSTDNHKQKLFT